MKSSDTGTSPDQTAETGIADAAPLPAATSSTLYSIIAVYLPVSIMATGLPAITALVSKPWPGQASSPWGFLAITVIGTAMASSFFYHFTKTTKGSQTAPGIRGAVIAMILAYMITSLLRIDRPWSGRFIPGLINILAPLIAIYVWYSVLSASRLFRARELLETYTARYDGAKLQQAMLADAALLAPADSRGAKVRLFYTTQLIIIILLAAAWTVLKSALPVPLLVLLLIHIIGAICFFTVLTLFKQEHYYAGAGISVPPLDRSKGIAGMIAFSLIAAVLALLLASDKSILPISLIIGFFAWLFGLLARAPRPQEPMEMSMPEMPPAFEGGNLMSLLPPELMQETEPSPFWEYLKYAAIAAAIMGFVWFMIKPLFFRSRRSQEVSASV